MARSSSRLDISGKSGGFLAASGRGLDELVLCCGEVGAN